MNASRVFITMGAVLSMSLVGCGGATDGHDQLAAQEAELGEIGCSTAHSIPYLGKSPNGKSKPASASCGVIDSMQSNSWTYDNPGCTDQYIFEITDIEGRAFSATPLLDFDIESMWCGNHAVEAALYLRDATTQQWTVHTTKLVGNLDLGYCTLGLAPGYSSLPSVTGAEGYDLARIAVKGTLTLQIYANEPPSVFKMPVRVDVEYPPSPC